MRAFAYIIALLISAPLVSAQPTYVSCIIPPEKKAAALNFDFTLDETAGTVAFYWNDHIQLLRAVFSADKVMWDQPWYLGTTIHRTINRVTLEYTDELVDNHKTPNSKGSCKVVEAPVDRKF